MGKFIFLVDLARISEKDFDLSCKRRFLGLTVLHRLLLTINEIDRGQVLIRYKNSQEEGLGEIRKDERLLSRVIFFSDENDSTLVQKILEDSNVRVLWIAPNVVVNKKFLARMIDEATLAGPTLVASDPVAGKLLPFILLRNNFPKADLLDEDFDWSGAIKGEVTRRIPTLEISFAVVIKEKKDFRRACDLISKDIVYGKGGPISKRINESVSLPIARFFTKTSITPNMLSIVNMVLGAIAILCVAHWNYSYVAFGAILFYLVDIFDGIDGELARYKFQTSDFGALLDTISDNTILLGFVIACYINHARLESSNLPHLLGGLALLIAAGMIFYLYVFVQRHFGNASLTLYDTLFVERIPTNSFFMRLIQINKKWMKKDVYAFCFSAYVLFGRPDWVFYHIIFGTSFIFFWMIVLEIRYKEILAETSRLKILPSKSESPVA